MSSPHLPHRKSSMTDVPHDWASSIITTILAALGTAITTVIGLAKYIETKYVSEIRELKTEMHEIVVKHEECLEKHHQAELRLAALEYKNSKLNKE